MLPIIHSYWMSCSVKGKFIPSFKWKWLDSRTLYIRVYGSLGENVSKYQIIFNDLKTLQHEKLAKKVGIFITE